MGFHFAIIVIIIIIIIIIILNVHYFLQRWNIVCKEKWSPNWADIV